jgi:DNA polymerase delta subunit 4
MIQELENFDADPKYGPSLNITRQQRWENSKRLNLNPPKSIPSLIKETGHT